MKRNQQIVNIVNQMGSMSNDEAEDWAMFFDGLRHISFDCVFIDIKRKEILIKMLGDEDVSPMH